MEAQASWACGLPWVASFQEQVPRASSQEEEGPSSASWEDLPCGVQASCQGEEDPGDWGEVGSWPLQEEEQRMELEVSFLVEMQPLFCQSGSGPALPSISGSSLSHSLCVSDHCSVSFSQMENHGSGTYHSSHNKTSACCSAGRWLPGSAPPGNDAHSPRRHGLRTEKKKRRGRDFRYGSLLCWGRPGSVL